MSTIIETAPAAQPSPVHALRWTAAAHVLEWLIPFSLVAVIIVGMALVLSSKV
jgi:hypothetical protein